jgi:glyoxylate/hydroxypyruvate reductase A
MKSAKMTSPVSLVFKSDPVRGEMWRAILARRAPNLGFHVWPETGAPIDVRYLVAWDIPDNVKVLFPGLEVIFATGAGIDHIDFSRIPNEIPVVRMVEPGISAGMVEYAVLSVLGAHRHLIDYIAQQREGKWQELRVVPANTRTVGVMGTGVLGTRVLGALTPFQFKLRAWSRTSRSLGDNVTSFSGAAALDDFLRDCDILICLLPLTDETRGILDARCFAALPQNAVVINASRGGNLVEADLIAALDHGHLSGAVLDVTGVEPLPAGHPFWTHRRILLTPHIATMTQPETAAEVVLQNIERHLQGMPLFNVIDRRRGY